MSKDEIIVIRDEFQKLRNAKEPSDLMKRFCSRISRHTDEVSYDRCMIADVERISITSQPTMKYWFEYDGGKQISIDTGILPQEARLEGIINIDPLFKVHEDRKIEGDKKFAMSRLTGIPLQRNCELILNPSALELICDDL